MIPSLRLRVAGAILALVAASVVASGWLASRRVVAPFAREVRSALADQAVFVARRWAAGEDPARLEEAFGVTVRPVSAPPVGDPRRFRIRRRAGRPPVVVPETGDTIYVRTRRGWVAVAHAVDLDRPGRNLRGVLLAAFLVLAAVAAAIAVAATRPLAVARDAMRDVAAGDLSIRLDTSGPSEIRDVARAFNAMTDRVAAMIEAQRQLLAGVSHELRTPITRLRLAVELLRDEGAPEARLGAMEADLAELESLLAELLALSRLQLGDAVAAKEPVDLRALAEEIAARHERVVVTGPPRRITGDPTLLRRALDNLVRNALRYAPDGPVEVRIGASGITVADRGPGVPEADLPRLFEPFFRVDRSRTRDTGGVGLGLLIVRQVAELHGGWTAARNRPGGGLEVTLGLPGLVGHPRGRPTGRASRG